MNADLYQIGLDAVRNRVFTKNDIINAFLRAGVAVENVDHQAQLFIDYALSESRIKPLANKPDKFTRSI
jgi:hypothetical protein